jgi:hypothetical protein
MAPAEHRLLRKMRERGLLTCITINARRAKAEAYLTEQVGYKQTHEPY